MGEIRMILEISTVAIAGAAVWTALAGSTVACKESSLVNVMTGLQMPSEKKKLLRQQLINHFAEGRVGSWESRWGLPTGDSD